MRTKLALLAFLLLTAAVLRSGGSLDGLSLLLVLGALVAALVGAGQAESPRPTRDVVGLEDSTHPTVPCSDNRSLGLILGGLLVIDLLWLALRPESAYLPREELAFPPMLAAVLIGLLSLSYAWTNFPLPQWRFPAVLAVYLALGSWIITEAAPAPAIDVWHFQQHAAERLRAGANPYTGEYPNPHEDARFLSERLLDHGKIQAFPYPPLSLLLVLPGYLLGDVRWSLLLGMLGSAWFMVATGRKLGLPPGHPAELAAIVALCNPWGMVVVELAWTEPLLALAVSFTIWTLAGGERRLTVLGLMGVLSLKQYGFLLLPAFAGSRRLGIRDVLGAVIGSLGIALPFLLWDPGAFQRGILDFHLQNPFRPDSLSVLAALAVTTGCQLPGWIGLLMAAGVGGWLWLRGKPVLSTAALGGAAVVLAFFAFNRAAHLNYYWLALMLLGMAVIVVRAEHGDRTVPDHPPDSGERLR